MRKTLLVLALAAVALGAAPTADAVSRCGRQLINDWYDGRIDKRYPRRCYGDAIRFANANPEIRAYSSLAEDLRRALLASLREQRKGGKGTPEKGNRANAATVRPGFPGRKTGPRYPGKKRSGSREQPREKEADPDGEVAAVSRGEGDDGGGSLPLPLILLGALGGLLLLAGAATYGRRWLDARQVHRPDSAA